ncbi:MAG: D-alanyl-D-alanine carboxypeptidase/D-alanyl-D-alanine-endopeptidase [Myxococcales bacterium]|nr:D-alanyl-D-alanine carboxypeptidase/D-alanyl-D-alanine-endopeptidase [Myxococcales bacterium]
MTTRLSRTALALVVFGVFGLALPAEAKPSKPAKPSVRLKARVATKAAPVRGKAQVIGTDGAHATISIGAELRPIRELMASKSPLTVEEETATKIAKLLRGPLRNGDTGLYVVDARTNQPLFAINADEAFNPASNVKMISTAASLELLGPAFRYPTRLLGAAPEGAVIHGDVYLLGSYDPTLTSADLTELAHAVAARGVTSIEGSVVIGADPTRDGIYRALIPIAITGGEPGSLAIATVPAGAEHVSVTVTAKTAKRVMRPRLTYKVETTKTLLGQPRIHVTIGGTIGKGGTFSYPLATRERTATAAYALKGALAAAGVRVSGDLKVLELGDFVGDAVGAGSLPIELGRHDSRPLAEIVTRINKWSINWLADRVIMTAAALSRRQPPSMELAVDAMYTWLARRPHLSKSDLYVDTGSGLSYRTKISPTELVSIVRSASGYAQDSDPALGAAWVSSLSIAGTDGTLRHRVRGAELTARVRGKTGTLSTAIAMSGLLDVDPDHPLAFALVTNTKRPLSKGAVRKAHDQLIGALCTYAAKTSKVNPLAPAHVASPLATPAPALTPAPASPTTGTTGTTGEPQPTTTAVDAEEVERDPVLDAETSGEQ